MSKRVIHILIAIMVVVMTGLILVQTNSILKALEIKEEQFNASVKNALIAVSNRLEMEEALVLAAYEKDLIIQRKSGVFPSNAQRLGPGTLSQRDVQISLQYSQQVSGSVYSEEFNIEYGSPEDQNNERGRPGDFPNAFDRFHEYDGFVSKQYEDRLNQRARMLALTQFAFIQSNLPIDERIDPTTLGRFIKTELKKQGINMDFKYAVKSFSRGEERFIFGDKSYNTNERKEYSTLLFPNDFEELKKPNWFVPLFSKTKYLLIKRNRDSGYSNFRFDSYVDWYFCIYNHDYSTSEEIIRH